MKRKYYIKVHKNHLKNGDDIAKVPKEWDSKSFKSNASAENELDEFKKSNKIFKSVFRNKDAIYEINESE